MKKVNYLILCFVFLFLLSSCGDSPSEVYIKMINAAKKGDMEKFLNGFTEESKPIIQSLIYLSQVYGISKKEPITLLTEGEVLYEEIIKDKAYLTIKLPNIKKRLLMKKYKGKWKIDIFELEKFFNEERFKKL